MNRRSPSLLFALILLLVAGLSGGTAFASHLRGTSVSWAPTGTPGTVQFTFQYSQRATFGCDAGTCVVGGTVSIPFDFGDGSSGVSVPTTVTSINSAEDYLSSTGTITHTYTGAGPYTAFYEDSARVSSIKSGSSQSLRMETLVSPFANPANSSPVSSMPAIVTIPLANSTGFNLSAVDPNGDMLSYRLATASEMYDNSSFSCQAQQPPGLSISNTGRVTWDTTQITAAGCGFAAPVSGDLWTVQFMVQDLDSNGNIKSKTPVDLIIKLITTTEPAPTVTFTNPGPITATPGSPVTFTVNSTLSSPNARVTFNVTGLPLGATATNTNQALTPPVSSVFNWTPTASQTGSYVVTYTVTNDTFGQTLGSVIINVPNALPPVTTCPASITAQYNTAFNIPVQVSDPQGDALTVVWSADGNTVRTDNVPASTSTTNLSLSQTLTTLGANSIAVNTTNTHSLSSSCSVPVTVNTADQTITFGALPAITYGDTPVVLTASTNSGLPIVYTATGACSVVNGAVQASGAGNCSITATQAGNSLYNVAPPVTQTVQIAQKPLTVTAQNATRQYGVANPAFTGTISGVVNNDAITATYSSIASTTSPVGTYTIVPALTGAALPNYAQTLNNGTLTITAGPATKLVSSAIATSIVSGGNLGAFTTLIQDAYGNTVTSSSAVVTATVTGPNGYSQIVSTAAVNGAASLNLASLGLTTAGTYIVTTGSSGLTGTSVTVTVTPGAAAKLVSTAVPVTLTAGNNVGTLAVTVQDANNNTVTSSSAPITATIQGPNGYSQTVMATAVNGVATLNLSSLNLTVAGPYTVSTNSPGLTGTSAPVTVAPGSASKLAVGVVPATIVSGSNLGSITVTVQDANDNTVTSSNAPITATVTGPNGYSSTVTGNAVNGVATLNLGSLSLNTAGTYTLTTASAGSTGTISTIAVTPGAASALTTSALPSTLTSGGNLGTITATIKDANGNIVTGSNAPVTVTVSGPNGYSQTITVAAVNGIASLNLSSLNVNTSGAYTVAVSSPGLPNAVSAVQVTSGAAAKVVTSAITSTVTSGNNLGVVTATVEDMNGNTVTSFNGLVTTTITGPNGYSQTVTSTAVNGVATLDLSSLSLAKTGTYSVTTSGAGSTVSIAAVAVTPGTPAKIVTGRTSSIITSGQTLGSVTVTVQDANGNVATNYTGPITATLTGTDGSVRTVTGTAVNGVGTLDLSSLTPTNSGNYTLTVSGSGSGLSTPSSIATAAITVAPASQTIALPALPDVIYGASTITLPATSSAGLPVAYTVTGPALVSGSTITITGAGTVTVTATQTGDASHSAVTAARSFVVSQAATSTSLFSSSGIALTGSPVTLTATVASTAGTPAGTVTFLNGTTVLGTVTLSSTGQATLQTSNLPTGVLNLSARYNGNTNYSASSSAASTTSVQDFAITSTSGTPSVPVVPGAATSFNILLSPSAGGFTGTITLTASGLPAGTTYSFSPATVTPGTTGVSTVLTVQTPKPIASNREVRDGAGVALALLILPLTTSRKARRTLKQTRILSLLAAVLLLGGLAGLTGCGSSNGFFGEPGHSYTVVVTGTSGNLVHSTEVVVNVQ